LSACSVIVHHAAKPPSTERIVGSAARDKHRHACKVRDFTVASDEHAPRHLVPALGVARERRGELGDDISLPRLLDHRREEFLRQK
jgi:hypothetical protein